jgi:hypothetical protein
MKAKGVYVKKILLLIYYISIGIFLFVCSLVIPFQQAEEAGIAYTNNHFIEYKKANGLAYVDEDTSVAKQIRGSGNELEKYEFKRLSGRFGLLSCVIVLGLTLLLPFARSSDVIWIGGYFSVLFGYGAMTNEFYFGIVLLALISYFVKRHIEKNRKSAAEVHH